MHTNGVMAQAVAELHHKITARAGWLPLKIKLKGSSRRATSNMHVHTSLLPPFQGMLKEGMHAMATLRRMLSPVPDFERVDKLDNHSPHDSWNLGARRLLQANQWWTQSQLARGHAESPSEPRSAAPFRPPWPTQQ